MKFGRISVTGATGATGAIRTWKKEPWDGGYGAFWLNGKVVRAHKAAYIEYVGPIPEGMVLLHECDNRRCVNYRDHIHPGTQLENVADMLLKGRGRGSN